MSEQGTVKWYSPAKGYGFIVRESGEEIFVHHSAIVDAASRMLYDGERVRFDVVKAERGLQARNVARLENG